MTEPTNMKEYVLQLALEVVEVRDGRRIGHTYSAMRELVLAKFPRVTYHGPWRGKPTSMTIKQIRELVYTMQGEDEGRTIRLPVRPRSKRAPRKTQ